MLEDGQVGSRGGLERTDLFLDGKFRNDIGNVDGRHDDGHAMGFIKQLRNGEGRENTEKRKSMLNKKTMGIHGPFNYFRRCLLRWHAHPRRRLGQDISTAVDAGEQDRVA